MGFAQTLLLVGVAWSGFAGRVSAVETAAKMSLRSQLRTASSGSMSSDHSIFEEVNDPREIDENGFAFEPFRVRVGNHTGKIRVGPHTAALKAAAWIGADAALNGLSNEFSAGPAKDEVLYGEWRGHKVVYFTGSDSVAEWLSNAACVVGACDTKKLTAEVDAKVGVWGRSNDVICVGFSRGNFMVSAYAAAYPANCRYVVGIASPGQIADPTSGAATVVINSLLDPVSWLNTPMEKATLFQLMHHAIHSLQSYHRAISGWARLDSKSDSELVSLTAQAGY